MRSRLAATGRRGCDAGSRHPTHRPNVQPATIVDEFGSGRVFAHSAAAQGDGHLRCAVVVDQPLECSLLLFACDEQEQGPLELPPTSSSGRSAAWVKNLTASGAEVVLCAPAPVARRHGEEIAAALGVPLLLDRSLVDPRFLESGFPLRRIAHDFDEASVVVVAPRRTIQSVLGTALTGRALDGRRFGAVNGAVTQLALWPDGGGVLRVFNSRPAAPEVQGKSPAPPGVRCRVALIEDAEADGGVKREDNLVGRRLRGLVASLRIETVYTAGCASHLATVGTLAGAGVGHAVEPGLGGRVDATKNGLRTTLNMPWLRATFARVCHANLGRTVAVVAHRWVVRSLICHTAQLDQRAIWRIATNPGAVNLVEVDGCGRGLVVSVNQVAPPGTGGES